MIANFLIHLVMYRCDDVQANLIRNRNKNKKNFRKSCVMSNERSYCRSFKVPKEYENGVNIGNNVRGHGEPLVLIIGFAATENSWI